MISKDLASLLNKCAIHGCNNIHHKLLGGPGHVLLHNDLGVELWTHIHLLYNPTSARWLWDYMADWGTLQQHQGEMVAALAYHLKNLEEQLKA
jgi:hypothetical protein